MPPSRRRPTPQPQPSSRRPKVAGLRRPAGPTKPAADVTDTDATDVTDVTDVTEEPVKAAEAAEADAVEVDEADAVEVDEAEPVDADDADDTDDTADDEPGEDEDVVEKPEDSAEADDTADAEPAAKDDDEEEDEEDEKPAAKKDVERKARPSGKRRSTGLRAPTAKADLAKAERRGRTERPARARSSAKRDPEGQLIRGRTTLAIVLVVIALVLGGLSLFFRIQAVNADDAADTGNAALTDTNATRQLIGELRPPIEAIFSIDYQHLDKTSQAASANLTGDARKQYDQLFGVVRENAAKQKLVSSFKIREISVMSLRGDSAEVLVFADQTSNKPCDQRNKEIRTCAAAIGVPAQRIDGHWKIAGFDMFNGNPVG